MAKLIHKNKIILKDMDYLTSVWKISKGLMFSSKKKCKKGVCLVMPSLKDAKFGSAVTMYFCFYKLEILFVNTKYKVVDKVTLMPFKSTYVPREACKYVIESYPGTFSDIKIGDKVKISRD